MRQVMCVLVGLLAATAPALADSQETDKAEVERQQIRSELLAQRKANIKRFHSYRMARVYPHNYYGEGMKNVWTDQDGHLCAVATMMDRDGQHDLVETVGIRDNFVRTADLTGGPVVDWIMTSGLTQEEIVMIQQPTADDVWEMDREYRAEQRKKARTLRHEDDRLEGNYLVVEQTLRRRVISDAALDLAVARIQKRPELVAALHARTAAY
jgi:hypothetical protein